jgi:protein TonB
VSKRAEFCSPADPRASTARAHGRAFAQCSEEARAPAWLVTAAAGLVHGSLFAAALYLSAPAPSQAAKPPARQLLEVELPPPPAPVVTERAPEPPPPQAPEPIKLKLAKAAAPAPAEPPPEPVETAQEPPPAAAQAAAAITQNDDAPAAPSDTLVTGSAASYAGGTTERGGSEAESVHAPAARASGVADSKGDAPVDRSQKPRLAGGTAWSCPFPAEAEEEGIDRAIVGLEVEVAANGSVLAVSVHSDPGSGFGREARACALKKRWLPALDRNGQPIQQKHRLNVSFTQK